MVGYGCITARYNSYITARDGLENGYIVASDDSSIVLNNIR